ncbi:MAG: hypothetical protein CUN55_07460 [Phototrophicales bacterium]|nr:MAG: hypothetical protein CUN55_07460 [Phototrophicales bacterium]
MLPELSYQFGLIITSGLLESAFLLWWQSKQMPTQNIRKWLDILLISGIIAIIAARIVHVWFINYRYFSAYPSDIWDIWYGGLNWQSGLIAGLTAILILARHQNINLAPLSDGIALCLPLWMLHGWWACRYGGCGYSTALGEDNHSTWLVGYLPDQFGDVWLRYEWQILGMAFALCIWLIIGSFTVTNRFQGKRLGYTLILIGVAMLALSLGRDDLVTTRIGTHGTRWLDILVISLGVLWLRWGTNNDKITSEIAGV